MRKEKAVTKIYGVNKEDIRAYLIAVNDRPVKANSGMKTKINILRCFSEQNLKMQSPVNNAKTDGKLPKKNITGFFMLGCSSMMWFAQISLIKGGK